jgi:hypothetical protein
MTRRGTAMRVTTVRFGEDLWRLLETEAASAGMSVSQYIREATLARAAAAAAVRGQDPMALLAGAPESPAPPARLDSVSERERAALLRQQANEIRQESRATTAEARQAIRRSGDLHKQGTKLRSPKHPAGD